MAALQRCECQVLRLFKTVFGPTRTQSCFRLQRRPLRLQAINCALNRAPKATCFSSAKTSFRSYSRVQRSSCITMSTAQNEAVAANSNLVRLREEMKNGSGGVQAVVVPSADPHLLEYAPAYMKRRAFISGFTGSAGTAVITTDKAALWTDGRYFLQAETELGEGWSLMKMGTAKCPQIPDWLCEELGEGSKVGVDASCHGEAEFQEWKSTLQKSGVELVALDSNPVDAVWGDKRPAAPKNPLRVHSDDLAGESVASKLERIRAEMKKEKAGAMLVGKVEEIAWILNLRGGDEPYSPIFISYLLILPESGVLYVDEAKVTDAVKTHLGSFGISVESYEKVLAGVQQAVESGADIWMNPSLTNAAVFNAARAAGEQETNGSKPGSIVSSDTPITEFMAVKNKKEVIGMKEAHLRDGAAVVEFLSWFEKEVASGKTFTEVEVDEALTARRAKQDGFVSLSFPTIAGAGPNGAVIHYSAAKETCRTVDANTLLLIDSGGQYDCGTTDITRTFHLGQPEAHQKVCFTRVLQGHIALSSACFPDNTPGLALDALARVPLWKMGLNYMHGTGHGVGAHLCVHEGPIQISHRYKSPMAQNPLKENMIVSNEPGYYEDGNFGIRIENLVHIKKANTSHNFGDAGYLCFDPITLVPIQKKMMMLDLMSQEEIEWVNSYHADVWEKISPRVSGEALEWLRESTSPLPMKVAVH